MKAYIDVMTFGRGEIKLSIKHNTYDRRCMLIIMFLYT